MTVQICNLNRNKEKEKELQLFKFKGGKKVGRQQKIKKIYIDGSRAICRVSPNCSFPQISKWDSLTKFVVLFARLLVLLQNTLL